MQEYVRDIKHLVCQIFCVINQDTKDVRYVTYFLIQLAKEQGLKKNDIRLWFGQLYGMSDHITYNLAAQGYNVAKYLPFGPVRDVMPYLIRRAEENTSVAGQTNRELSLLKKERSRRKL